MCRVPWLMTWPRAKQSRPVEVVVVPVHIEEANAAAWAFLASPGSWWSSAEKIAVARAVRQAGCCERCARRTQALSPFAVQGEHDGASELPPAVVDVVHRLVTDASRLTESWVLGLQDHGISAAAYVELVATTVFVLNVDLFRMGVGLPVSDLPAPGQGAPDGYLPASVNQRVAWVPTLSRPFAEAEEDLFADVGGRATLNRSDVTGTLAVSLDHQSVPAIGLQVCQRQ